MKLAKELQGLGVKTVIRLVKKLLESHDILNINMINDYEVKCNCLCCDRLNGVVISISELEGIEINIQYDSCKDKVHLKFFEKIKKELKKMMESEILKADLRLIIPDKSNEDFFGESRAVIDRQGGAGKTYQSALLTLYTILYTDNRIIDTTTVNENVELWHSEIIKIIDNAYEASDIDSDPIELLLKNKKLDVLGIGRMTSYSPLKESKIIEYKAITTNHTYLYTKGLSSKYFKNMLQLKNLMAENDIVIVDECHEFFDKSIRVVALNDYLLIKPDRAHQSIEVVTENPFQPCPYEEYNDNIHYYRGRLPRENRSYTYNKGGPYNLEDFRLACNPRFEENNIKSDLSECLFIDDFEHIYPVRGKGIYFKDQGQLYRLRRYDVVKNIKFNIDSNPDCIYIFNILETMVGGVYVTQNCCIEKCLYKDELTGEYKVEEMESFTKREQLFEFVKNNFEDWIGIWDTNLYKQLLIEGKELFKEYFVFRQKSILDDFKSKVYYMTATSRDLEKWGITVNRKFANEVFFKCDYEVLFIRKGKGIDKYINDLATKLGEMKYLDVLAFNGLDEKVKSIINKDDESHIKDNPDYGHVAIAASVGELKSHFVSCGAKEGNGTKKKSLLAYLNGTESTGKNYPEKNVVIINSKPDKNIKGRIIIKGWGNHEVIPIEDIDLNQATFRIHRGKDEKLKFIIFVGDDISIAKKYVNDRQGGGNKYMLVEVQERKAIESIAEYINIKIGIFNHGLKSEMPTFDRRQTTKNENAKKYDSYKVFKLYEEAQRQYLIENPRREKLSLRVASQILKISRPTLKSCLDEMKSEVDSDREANDLIEILDQYSKKDTFSKNVSAFTATASVFTI